MNSLSSTPISPSKKVLLIFPREKGIKYSNDTLYPFPMLGLTLLAAQFPKGYEIKIINEAIETIDFEAEVDLVGITSLTCTAKRAYEVADRFRKRGVKVVLGGVHPSLLPEEAKAHADSVFIGEAEGMLGDLIRDFEAGKLKPFYRNRKWSELQGMPMARRDLLSPRYSPLFKAIETTRGCPHRCEFCSVPVINGKRYRTRPLEEVDRELSLIVKKRGEYLFLTDDNVIAHEDYALGLFELFRHHGVKWMGFSTIKIARNEKLLKKAQESGCISLFIGFESLLQTNLDNVSKRFVDAMELIHAIRIIQAHGIGIHGSFIFGFDGDDPSVFKKTVDFVQKTCIEIPSFSVLTPFPGTELRKRLEKEGRIFDNDWSHYDMSHVVFQPRGMTARELQEGYLWAQKYTCAPRSILKRLLWGPKNHFFHFLMANFALRGAQMEVIHRIRKEMDGR
ncbi:MAG: B12-binding domain-containing radical SAM protein [Desulfobacterota bacterium]|nr:B12-binding domain-containing radical SAM protein [Thermodesulfobacteriota bacterium]